MLRSGSDLEPAGFRDVLDPFERFVLLAKHVQTVHLIRFCDTDCLMLRFVAIDYILESYLQSADGKASQLELDIDGWRRFLRRRLATGRRQRCELQVMTNSMFEQDKSCDELSR